MHKYKWEYRVGPPHCYSIGTNKVISNNVRERRRGLRNMENEFNTGPAQTVDWPGPWKDLELEESGQGYTGCGTPLKDMK